MHSDPEVADFHPDLGRVTRPIHIDVQAAREGAEGESRNARNPAMDAAVSKGCDMPHLLLAYLKGGVFCARKPRALCYTACARARLYSMIVLETE